MNQACKYHSNSSLQARDAAELLEKYKLKIKWDVDMKIIDIGCGPGNVTYDQLFPSILNDAELLGIDISESMIKLANSRYNRDSRLNFEALDILDPKVVEKYASYFNTAFSFYCFQWIQDQRNLMKTTYSILKLGGELLFMLVVDTICYRTWEVLAASPKWFHYFKNYKSQVSPYYNSIDPVSDVMNLMQNQGFHVKECALISKFYTFSSKQDLYNWVDALNQFSKSIPKHFAKEYEQEWKKIMLDENLYIYHEATDEFTIRYLTVTGFAEKPY